MNAEVKKSSTEFTFTFTFNENEAYILYRILGNIPTSKAVEYANTPEPVPPKRQIFLPEVHELIREIHYQIDNRLYPENYDG